MCYGAHPSRFHGPDTIHNQMLEHLPLSTVGFLLNMCNRIWSEGSFPSKWKKTSPYPLGIALSLISCVCKMLQSIVNFRLVCILENSGFFSNYQCSFRRSRSPMYYLVTTEAQVTQPFIIKQHLVGVFLDIVRDYDTAWRYGILWILSSM